MPIRVGLDRPRRGAWESETIVRVRGRKRRWWRMNIAMAVGQCSAALLLFVCLIEGQRSYSVEAKCHMGYEEQTFVDSFGNAISVPLDAALRVAFPPLECMPRNPRQTRSDFHKDERATDTHFQFRSVVIIKDGTLSWSQFAMSGFCGTPV